MNINQRIFNILTEAPEAIRKSFRKEDPTGFAGPLAQRYGKERAKTALKKVRDPLVKSGATTAIKKMEKKLGVKSGSTNVQIQHAVRMAQLARSGKGPGLPRETRKDAAADWERDKWRRKAPGDK